MTSWGELVRREPDFTAALRARFDAHLHKLLATLRADGSPRISGIEVEFRDDHLWLAGMPSSRKFADLRRDPRLALHSSSDDSDRDDPGAWRGDAKLSGTAVEVSDPADLTAYAAASSAPMPPGPFDLFRVDVGEAVLVRIGEPADHLLIEHWNAEAGLRSIQRY